MTRRHALTNLSKSPGWDLYLKILQAQIDTRKNNIVFTPLAGLDESLQQEYQKGEVSGIYLAGNLNELILNALNAEISDKQTEEDEEDA